MEVKGLEQLKALPAEVKKAVKKAGRLGAKAFAQLQSDLIRDGVAPDGSRQPGESKTPLLDTGLLANAKKWRIASTVKGLTIRPPKLREKPLILLQRRGYKTILNTETPKGRALVIAELDPLLRQL